MRLKLSGKYLTKEGNKCNFLYSDQNIKARLGKVFVNVILVPFTVFSLFFLQSSLIFQLEGRRQRQRQNSRWENEWEMIFVFFNNVFFSFLSVSSLMVRWRYRWERKFWLSLLFWLTQSYSTNPFILIDYRATRNDERTCVHETHA